MEVGQILKKSRLRLTGCRKEVLSKMLSSRHAWSHADLERSLQDKYDRVTIYRTLSSFTDKGIIHKIPDDSGGVKYAICSENCEPEFHADNHVHFKCNVCGHTECLEDLSIPKVKIPTGYKVEEVALLARGICWKCNKP